MLSKNKNRRVAVVVPLSSRPGLTEAEKISLRHLHHYLGGYDRHLVAPPELDCSQIQGEYTGFEIKRFPDRYFGSVEAHTQLMLSRRFYRAFSDYEYILIYHLDALVFSDQLRDWCNAGFDFIGPPWIPCDQTPWVRQPQVGNGGFSLRRVESFLDVLQSRSYAMEPDAYWERYWKEKPLSVRLANLHRKWLKKLRRFNGIQWETRRWHLTSYKNEDFFWALRACRYAPFQIAPVEQALRFAFEAAPRRCYDLNDRRLPFGCHAWQAFEPDFWTPHLLT